MQIQMFWEQVTDLSSQFSDYAHIAKYPVYDLRHFLSFGRNYRTHQFLICFCN